MDTENIIKLKEELRRHEGLRLKPYRCSAGHLTIGYGHLITDHRYMPREISLDIAEHLLDADISDAIQTAKLWLSGIFDLLDAVRERVIVNMAFNLGYRLFQFKNLCKAITEQDWEQAVAQMKGSKWHMQVGNRARELESMMLKGTDDGNTTGNT